MSSGLTIAKRLAIIERSTSTSIDRRESIAVATGATGGSAGVGPAANLRWLVHAVGISVNFTAAPAAGDRASGSAQIVRGGIFHAFIGADVEDNFSTGVVTNGLGIDLVMVNGDTFRAFAGALGSSVGVTAVAVLWGIEYEAI